MMKQRTWVQVLVLVAVATFLTAGCKPSVTVLQMAPEQVLPRMNHGVDFTKIPDKEALETLLPDFDLKELGEPSNDQTIKWLDTTLPDNMSRKYGPAYAGMMEALRDCKAGSLNKPHSFMGLVANEHDHSYAATYLVLTVKYGSQNMAEDISNAHQFVAAANVPASDSLLGYFLLSRAKSNDAVTGTAARQLLLRCLKNNPKNLVAMKEYASACESGFSFVQDKEKRLLPVIGPVPDFKTALQLRKRILHIAPNNYDNAYKVCQDMFELGDPVGAKREANAYIASLSVVTAKKIAPQFSSWLTNFVGDATFIDGRRRAIVYSFPPGGKKSSDYLVSYLTFDDKILKPQHYKPVDFSK